MSGVIVRKLAQVPRNFESVDQEDRALANRIFVAMAIQWQLMPQLDQAVFVKETFYNVTTRVDRGTIGEKQFRKIRLLDTKMVTDVFYDRTNNRVVARVWKSAIREETPGSTAPPEKALVVSEPPRKRRRGWFGF